MWCRFLHSIFISYLKRSKLRGDVRARTCMAGRNSRTNALYNLCRFDNTAQQCTAAIFHIEALMPISIVIPSFTRASFSTTMYVVYAPITWLLCMSSDWPNLARLTATLQNTTRLNHTGPN